MLAEQGFSSSLGKRRLGLWDRYSMDAVFMVLWLREQWGARVAIRDCLAGMQLLKGSSPEA